ncbi:MAG TPA: AAA family ATPase [Bacilli bacterium]|mgnify:CR=1 FL=1|nr:AAA family ATPase [Bacilli bacterium]
MEYKFLKTEDEIYNYFLKYNPISKGNKKHPYVILFDAISGMGKSTVAKMFSKKLDIKVLGKDKIRQFIYRTSFPNNPEKREKLTSKIQNYRVEETIKNGNNCIIDGNVANNFKEKISLIEKYHLKYYIIKLICDREIVLEREKNRKVITDYYVDGDESIDYSGAGVSTFLNMEKRKKTIPKQYINFEIDTSKSLKEVEKQVEVIANKINNENS